MIDNSSDRLPYHVTGRRNLVVFHVNEVLDQHKDTMLDISATAEMCFHDTVHFGFGFLRLDFTVTS